MNIYLYAVIAIELAADKFLKFLVNVFYFWFIRHFPSPKYNVKVFTCPLKELK